jgi:hypothetical protein
MLLKHLDKVIFSLVNSDGTVSENQYYGIVVKNENAYSLYPISQSKGTDVLLFSYEMNNEIRIRRVVDSVFYVTKNAVAQKVMNAMLDLWGTDGNHYQIMIDRYLPDYVYVPDGDSGLYLFEQKQDVVQLEQKGNITVKGKTYKVCTDSSNNVFIVDTETGQEMQVEASALFEFITRSGESKEFPTSSNIQDDEDYDEDDVYDEDDYDDEDYDDEEDDF